MTSDGDQYDHVVFHNEINHNPILHINRNGTVSAELSLQFVEAKGWMMWIQFQELYRTGIRFPKGWVKLNKQRELPLIRFSRDQFWHLFTFRRFPDWLFAYGFITDTLDGYRHAYVLHVSKNGDILSSTDVDQIENSHIRLLNDGTGNIVVSNLKNLEVEVIIYNQLGVIVLRKTIMEDNSTLDLEFLPSACYFYSIIENLKIIYSGKLAKLN